MDNKTLLILLGAVAVYFLFIKPKTVATTAGVTARPPSYAPPPQQGYQPSVGQQIGQGFAAAAPALGSFLGNLFGGSQGSSSGSDDLLQPSFNTYSNSSFSDDSYDFA